MMTINNDNDDHTYRVQFASKTKPSLPASWGTLCPAILLNGKIMQVWLNMQSSPKRKAYLLEINVGMCGDV